MWTIGAVGVSYFLRVALREDLTAYGLRLRPAPWIFVSRYAAFLATIGFLGAYTAIPAVLSIEAQSIVVVLPALAGLAYVGRRYLELRTTWLPQLMHALWQPRELAQTIGQPQHAHPSPDTGDSSIGTRLREFAPTFGTHDPEDTEPNYEDTRDEALERDEYTCQLCGEPGYPKAERGLAAYPVDPEDYHLENLVTVCHDCLQMDDQQLRQEAERAKQWRDRDHNDEDT